MIGSYRRLLLNTAALVPLALSLPAAVEAQDYPTVISPLRVEQDVNGVNLVDGKTTIDVPVLSVPGDPHLRFDRVQNAAPYMSAKITRDPDAGVGAGTYSVHTMDGTSESFRCADLSCSSVTGSGSVLGGQGGSYLKAGSGEIYSYNLLSTYGVGPTQITKQAYAGKVTYPDGEIISFSYDSATLAGDTSTIYLRPNKLSSNTGYYITLTYFPGDLGTQNWNTVSQATLYNVASPTTPLAQFTYGSDYASVTDLAGRTYHITNAYNGLGTFLEVKSGTIQLPTEAAVATTYVQGASLPLITSVSKDGVQWSYSYANPTFYAASGDYVYNSLTVSGPVGYHKTYTMTTAPGSRNTITGITDELSRTTSFLYDTMAIRVVKETFPELNYISLSYDTYGNITQKTTVSKPNSPLPNLVEQAFVDTTACAGVLCYRPVWYKDALNRETDFAYNSQGMLTEQTDPADGNGVRRKTYITYDAHASSDGSILYRKNVERICGLTTTCGTNAEIRTEYDYWGNTFLPSAKREIDAAAGVTLTTTYTYDGAGRLLIEDGPLAGAGDAKYYRYDVVGRKTWEIGPANASGVRVAKRYTYRASDDKVTLVEAGTVTDPNSTTLTVTSQVATSYDAHRNAIRATTSSSGTTMEVADASFDDRAQQLCATTRMNFASLPADACTLGSVGGYGQDRIVHNMYDAAGQLTQIQKGYGTSLVQNYVTYSYTPNGKQQYITDANGNKAQMAYDALDRLQYWYFPSKTSAGSINAADYEQYGYDAAGNRTSLRRRDGRTFAFTFDGLNRVTKKVVPDGCAPIQSGACPATAATRDVYYGYDVRGLQLYARFDSATGDGVTNTYDGFSRLTSSVTAMSGTSRSLSYGYDADGNRTKITYPDGAYFSATYDTADHLQQILDQSSTQLTLMGYDGLGRRTSAFAGSETYGFDGANRLTSQGVAFGKSYDVSRTFGYNPADQIISQARSNDGYAYSGYVSLSRGYAVNGLNQYTTAGPATFGYDADGNLISDGSTTYGYDAENRLISSSSGAALVYDPLGRLWQTSGGPAGVTQFLYDGDALVAEYNSANALLRRYVHGADAGDDPILWYEGSGVTAAQRRSMLADHQGSIDLIIDGSGNQIGINSYDSYGIPRTTNLGRFQYTGQAWIPELGMYYYKARIYSPTLGRFMQTDPIGYKDQINLYAYVENDPMNREDPSGDVSTCLEANTCHPESSSQVVDGFMSYPKDIAILSFYYGSKAGLFGVQNQNRALLIDAMANRAISAVERNPRFFFDKGLSWMREHHAFVTGRALAGASVSTLGGPFVGGIGFGSAGAGGAISGLRQLGRALEAGHISTNQISSPMLGTAATLASMGASLGFDAKTGNVTATFTRTDTGTRIPTTHTGVICNVNKGGCGG